MASQAARFAAKEALAKALGAPQGMSWQDAEIVTDAAGRPFFEVPGTVAARLAELASPPSTSASPTTRGSPLPSWSARADGSVPAAQS